MSENDPNVPTSTVIGCLAPFVIVPLALLAAVNTDGLLRLIAIAVLALFAIWFIGIAIGRDPIDAWRNERLNEAAPWLHRNEDIGKVAVAIGEFERSDGQSTGKVKLDGEIWNAVCKDNIEIDSGVEVYIIAREGLTLEVSLNEESVPGGLPY